MKLKKRTKQDSKNANLAQRIVYLCSRCTRIILKFIHLSHWRH